MAEYNKTITELNSAFARYQQLSRPLSMLSATGVADNIDLSLGNSSYHAQPLVNPLSASAFPLISKIVWLKVGCMIRAQCDSMG
jgi:hypothetical protein